MDHTTPSNDLFSDLNISSANCSRCDTRIKLGQPKKAAVIGGPMVHELPQDCIDNLKGVITRMCDYLSMGAEMDSKISVPEGWDPQAVCICGHVLSQHVGPMGHCCFNDANLAAFESSAVCPCRHFSVGAKS